MARKRCIFTQTDVSRAVKGAVAAGLMAFSVTITPDGSIKLDVGHHSPTAVTSAPADDPSDEAALLAKLEALKLRKST